MDDNKREINWPATILVWVIILSIFAAFLEPAIAEYIKSTHK